MQLGNEVHHRQGLYGLDNITVGWVKTHVGIEGNERANEMAKIGAAKEGRNHVTEGGLLQWEKGRRRDNRMKAGYLDAMKCDKYTTWTYTKLKSNRGNLSSFFFFFFFISILAYGLYHGESPWLRKAT